MAERPNLVALHKRVQQVRRELYGEEGLAGLADALKIPHRTWQNYESGVTIPAAIMLNFMILTGANARWLLTGEGNPYAVESGYDGRSASI